jgi:hypothetical protein
MLCHHCNKQSICLDMLALGKGSALAPTQQVPASRTSMP